MKSSDPLSILNEVRRLEIITRGSVDTLLKGFYKSTFRGNGLEFHQVREYTPEDDVRSIDWNVTARLNAPFVKTFVEERELQLILAVDLSASLWYGTGPLSKRETALRLCAVLAFAAAQHQDRVGLYIFTDRMEYFIPPKRGRAATMRILRELIQFKPQGKKTDYKPAFQMLSKVLKRRSVLILVSDFTEPIPMESASVLAQRHDLVAVVVKDPLETNFRLPARVAVRDPESGKVGYLSPSSHAALRKANEFRENQLWSLTAKGADRMDIQAGENVIPPLMKFFKKRIERLGRR
ncbi:MAG TPA: DUF58 domain-containing protein [bacterium]|nr:DUF58 domain-containing protein [bacterium]